jgi:hypothetical protein
MKKEFLGDGFFCSQLFSGAALSYCGSAQAQVVYLSKTMTVRVFVITTAATAAASWGIWGLIISWLDPVQAGVPGYGLFFLSLFLAVVSSVSLVGYALRRIVIGSVLPAYHVRPALRQAFLVGIFTVLVLSMQLARLNRGWLVMVLLCIALATEALFVSYDKTNSRH